MDILERLRSETRDLHKTLEDDLPIMRPDLQLSDYGRLLARFYGVYLPLEGVLAGVPNLSSALPDWPQRRKLEWLVKDLSALGFSGQEIAEVPSCPRVPAIRSVEGALGCLYVLEGSTLGGQIISRHLETTLDLGLDNGASFFRCYGDRIGPMWKKFQEALLSRAQADHDRMVSAAVQTFECIGGWLKDPA
jgi:heme oxygenase